MESFNKFNDKFVKEIDNWVAELNAQGGEFTIEKTEVTKSNDRVMHALILKAKDIVAAPTIYVEDFYRKYKNGARMNDLVREAWSAFAFSVINQPQLLDYDYMPKSIMDIVVLRLFETNRNRKWLKDCIYKDMGNGFCAVPYVMLNDFGHGVYGHPIDKKTAKDEKLDEEALFDNAMKNTVRRLPPLFVEASEDALNQAKYNAVLNPFSEDFEFNDGAEVYMLTSQSAFNGSIALFYPKMTEIIGELLGCSYYVMPISFNEILIFPVNKRPDLSELQQMLRDINMESDDAGEVLSDKILKYDRKKGILVEPPDMTKEHDTIS